ncbi:hypothetical protein XPA_006205 [Xanthoria parietina]
MSSVSNFMVFCFFFTLTISAVDDTRGSASFSLLSGIEKSPLRDVLRLNPPLSTTLGDRLITCDPRRFGMPSVASCVDAISQLPQPTAEMLDRKRSYGPRGGTRRQYDVELPKRWISSDGKCIIDVTQTSFPSHERDINMVGAATVIRQECLEKAQPPWGGYGHALGDEGNLNISVAAYTPPYVKCEGAPPARRPNHEACQRIIDLTMKASTARATFAAQGVPLPGQAVERLPQALVALGGGCTITIDTNVPVDTASWYEIWAAAVAVDGMCVRGGRTGRARFLGTNRKLTVQITR